MVQKDNLEKGVRLLNNESFEILREVVNKEMSSRLEQRNDFDKYFIVRKIVTFANEDSWVIELLNNLLPLKSIESITLKGFVSKTEYLVEGNEFTNRMNSNRMIDEIMTEIAGRLVEKFGFKDVAYSTVIFNRTEKGFVAECTEDYKDYSQEGR